MTYTEHERAAYMAGDYKTADAYAKLEEAKKLTESLLDVLYDALPYVEDVLADPEQLKCFRPGVVQAHAKAIRAAIAKAEAAK